MALTDAARTAAATAIVQDFAPSAPADVRAAAVHLVAESIRYDPLTESVQFADQEVKYTNLGPSIIRRCGASSILAPWRRPRARAIEVAS